MAAGVGSALAFPPFYEYVAEPFSRNFPNFYKNVINRNGPSGVGSRQSGFDPSNNYWTHQQSRRNSYSADIKYQKRLGRFMNGGGGRRGGSRGYGGRKGANPVRYMKMKGYGKKMGRKYGRLGSKGNVVGKSGYLKNQVKAYASNQDFDIIYNMTVFAYDVSNKTSNALLEVAVIYRLNQIDGYGDFTTIFDEFQIVAVETFAQIPYTGNNMNGTVASHTDDPKMVSVICTIQHAAFGTFAAALLQDTAIITLASDRHVRFVQPKLQLSAGSGYVYATDSGLTYGSAYVVLLGESQWATCSVAGLDWIGMNILVGAFGSALNVYRLAIVNKFHLQFRNRK